VFSYDKETSERLSGFPIPAFRNEAAACDNVTFAEEDFDGMWIKDLDGFVRAFVVPKGTCNIIPPPSNYTASTLSSVLGNQTTSVSNPSDAVSINGTDSVFGNFTGTAALVTSSVTVATSTCTPVNGLAFPLNMTCTAISEITAPGTYCWNVTITENSGNYDPPVLVLNGADDATKECFDVLPDGMLQINKTAVGGNGEFSFVSNVTGLNNFNITTSDGAGSCTRGLDSKCNSY
jgi:hypothetical protein